MATLSYNGASFTFPNLTAHPLAFDVTDAARGQVAEALTFTGILSKTEANTLKGIWQAWRDAKLPEEAHPAPALSAPPWRSPPAGPATRGQPGPHGSTMPRRLRRPGVS